MAAAKKKPRTSSSGETTAASIAAAWKAMALGRARGTVLERLQLCEKAMRPQTREKLASFAKTHTRSGVKLYVFDPRDVVRDLLSKQRLDHRLSNDVLDLLKDVAAPSDDAAACGVPLEERPSEFIYNWRRVPETLLARRDAKQLASWCCERASVTIHVLAHELLQRLLDGSGTMTIHEDSSGRLKYVHHESSTKRQRLSRRPLAAWKFTLPRKPPKILEPLPQDMEVEPAREAWIRTWIRTL